MQVSIVQLETTQSAITKQSKMELSNFVDSMMSG